MRSKRTNVLRNLFSNEKKLHDNLSKTTSCQVTPELIDRLGLETELEGHEGCVNCIDWSYNGKFMVTGSDDRTVIVWNPHTRMKVAHLRTQHTNNIFSVRFIPESNDGLVATGAGDSRVSLVDVERNETLMVCSCHLGRVKKLAASRDSPFLLWSGAEDGTVRQMDLREPHSCSENTSEILVNLLIHTGSMAEIKTIAANPVRSELLAVGANDPYARLYDRRKIKPYTCKVGDLTRIGRPLIDKESEENQNLLPSGCANYFVPGHVPCRLSDYKRHNRSIAATHVAFDPSGQKLLVNLGGEQIYLYDIFDKVKPVYMSMGVLESSLPSGSNVKSKDVPPNVQILKEQANTAYDKSQYNLAVDLYNEALLKCPNSALLLSNKSAALMKRRWAGDVYEALRHCMLAIELDPEYMKAYYRVARCLLDLGMLAESQKAIAVFESKFPNEVDTKWFRTLKQDLTKLSESEAKLQSNGHSRSSESSSRFETSENGNEFIFVNTTRVFDKNRNLSEFELAWRKEAGDYEQRFCGHCNTTTDIKEANFFGGDGEYIIAGSDDGSFFIWDRETTNIVRILKGDDSIVNCLQPHPTTCLLATSGIDSVVRLWSPRPEDFKNDRVVEDSASAALANQRRMESDPLQMMLISMGYNIPQSDDEGGGGGDAPPHCRTS